MAEFGGDRLAWPGKFNVTFTPEVLMTPAEVAKLFKVNPKTVTRWAKDGKLPAVRTLGGHRRFPALEVQRLYRGETNPAGTVSR